MRKKNRFAFFGSYLRQAPTLLFVLVLMAMAAVVSNFVMLPVDMGWLPDLEFFPSPNVDNYGTWPLIFMSIIVAPLAETLLFQHVPYAVLRRVPFFATNRWAMLVVSGAIFGAMHYYSLAYILATSLMGGVMMYGYIVKYRRRAYWSMVLFHSMWNLLVVVMQLLGVE
ncbi:MAG: CPBP family intramembrane glutamic endopeptidase [Mucinivorans sp.]